MHGHAKPLLELVAQVDPTPADNLVCPRLRASLDQRYQRLLLIPCELRWTTRGLAVLKSRKTFGIIPVDPIAKRLAVHSATPRRRRPINAFQDKRQGQYPTRRSGTLRSTRRLPQLGCRHFMPSDLDPRHHCLPILRSRIESENQPLGNPRRATPFALWYKLCG